MGKRNRMKCAPSKDSHQHPSLIRVLSVRIKRGSLATHLAHSEYFDQTGCMPRLVRVFAVRTCHCLGFVVLRLLSTQQPRNVFCET